MDGSIFWQSAFLLNDGRIISFGAGNHVWDQTNSMRCIDPVREPGVLQPTLDVILFRGRPSDIGNEVPQPDFGWNRLTFTN